MRHVDLGGKKFYYSIMGYYWIMERNIETSMVYWGNIGRMEKKMGISTHMELLVTVLHLTQTPPSLCPQRGNSSYRRQPAKLKGVGSRM